MKQAKKIYLIEDDQFLGRVYTDGLEHAEFEPIYIDDATKAMERMKNVRPDLVLLDLVMPQKSGFEILEEMKRDDELKDVPVIILSSLGQKTDIDKGMALGAVDYLIKTNWSMKRVIEKIKEHLVMSDDEKE